MRLKLKDLKSLKEVLNYVIEKMEKNAKAQRKFQAKKRKNTDDKKSC